MGLRIDLGNGTVAPAYLDFKAIVSKVISNPVVFYWNGGTGNGWQVAALQSDGDEWVLVSYSAFSDASGIEPFPTTFAKDFPSAIQLKNTQITGSWQTT